MVFNWFRRQYSESGSSQEETPSEQPQDAPAASPPVEPATDAAAPTPAEQNSPAVAEDYLNWAKAAYKNIQKQQKPEAETADSIELEETQKDAAASIAAEPAPEIPEIAGTAPEPEPTAEIAEIAQPVTAPPEIAPPAAAQIEVPAENLEIPEPATPVAETPAAGDAEPLPFWARDRADRMERIERLKETAIEEPDLIAASAGTALREEIPAFAFDEGFLWSSEILASQGRRPDEVSVEEITWLQKLRKGLERTRRSLINQLKAIVGQGPLNQEAVAEIESLLLQADVGVAATDIIISRLQERLRQEVLPPEQAIAYLKQILRDLLDAPCAETAGANPAYSLTFAPEKDTFNLWLIVGVNGAGKTTTIGKLAHIAQKSGYKTLIAAADTFRAAAVEQVKVWGNRSGVEVIANPGKNTDPAAVVFDAIAAAQARGTELLIVDTAGRLQNKKNLMDELSKIRRIADKKAPGATVESLLVLDATLGQNGLRQAEVFAEAAKLSGVILTKLDGTAKGGVALAVVQQLSLPIRFIGVGESIEDLRPFSSYEFVEALLDFRF